MTLVLAIEIPGLPRRTNNSQSSWRAKMAEARKWKSLVESAVILSRQKPKEPLKKARLILTRFSSSEPDADGLVSGFKHPTDGLIKAGVIENDKPENIGFPEFRWVKIARNQGKIRIEVYSLEEVSNVS